MLIANKNIENPLMMAPLAGITDFAYRQIVTEYGADIVFSEMVSAKAITYKNGKTMDLLLTDRTKENMAVQLFGSEPDIIYDAIKMIDRDDFIFYNLNAGCPVPKVVNNGEGSALLKNPELLGRIVKSMRAATDKMVTVKIRSGFNEDMINAAEVGKIVEANGADFIIIHGRTRKKFYSGEVDYKPIADLKRSVNIPVIGNGDIFDGASAKKMYDNTGVDGLMLARGAIGNPFLFREIRTYLETGQEVEPVSSEELVRVIRKHMELLVRYKGEYIGFREFRKHLGYYVKGRHNASKIRAQINQISSGEDLEEILEILLEGRP